MTGSAHCIPSSCTARQRRKWQDIEKHDNINQASLKCVGRELLRMLGGSNVVINLSRRAPPADIAGSAKEVVHIETDLADAASVAQATHIIRQRYGQGIDGLINCAALQLTTKLTASDFDRAGFAKEIATNLTSPIELISDLLPSLYKRPKAFILNVNSGLGIVPKHESTIRHIE